VQQLEVGAGVAAVEAWISGQVGDRARSSQTALPAIRQWCDASKKCNKPARTKLSIQ